MSNTRYAAPGGALNQNRFASSPEYDSGLLANLVSKRCKASSDTEERRLIQAIQWFSHQEGGLKKMSADLVSANPDRIGTPTMIRIGKRRGQSLDASQVVQVRGELPANIQDDFLLCGESNALEDLSLLFDSPSSWDDSEREVRPKSYPFEAFQRVCQVAAVDRLERHLAEVCLNPASSLRCDPWYFAGLMDAVRAYVDTAERAAASGIVMTELSRAVFGALDYGLQSRCMVVVEGLPRTGKSFSASSWCLAHAGHARLIQTPASCDDIGFFREVSKGIGSSAGSCMKATQMRDKVEDALQGSGIMVVFDEAHNLLPQRNLRYAVPNRLNWVMTALVNRGVPVGLITTPQFANSQKAIEKKTGWASEQFCGRVGHWQRLPDRLPESDLSAIASHLLPGGDERCIAALVAYAQSSSRYLAGIEAAARRASYLAKRDGRAGVTLADVKDAIQGGVIPSDTALAVAFGGASARYTAGRTSKEPRRADPPKSVSPVCGGQSAPDRRSGSGHSRLPIGMVSERLASRVRSTILDPDLVPA